MIIRKEVQLTLKASSFNSRRSERLRVGELAREYDLRIVEKGEKSTPEGCAPTAAMGGAPVSTGDPFRVDVTHTPAIRGCSLRSYPRLLRGDAFSVLVT